MKELLIVANWKMNKSAVEIREWFGEFSLSNYYNTKIVICPAFPYLSLTRELISQKGSSCLKLGAQNVSAFEEGACTGEVSGRQLKDLGVEYVIVGHSERRQNFGETDEQILRKIELCQKYNLKPIICVSNLKEAESLKQAPGSKLQDSKFKFQVLAYEPLFAVGTGKPDTPENAQEVALAIKGILGEDIRVLYGGSANRENAQSFTKQRNIAGLLIGTASLEASEFIEIIKACSLF